VERVIETRRKMREEAIGEARVFAECAKSKLGRVTAIVFGSYARGDFNAWSDIDLLAVTDTPLPPNSLKRLDVVEECFLEASGVEPVILTASEFAEKLHRRDPVAVEAVERGIIVLDDLGLAKLVKEVLNNSS